NNNNNNNNKRVKNVDEHALKKASIEPGWYNPAEPKDYKNKNKLRDYQTIGVNWMILKFLRGENFILADEMGLGKTVQSVCFLLHLQQECNIHGPYLIVAPLSTIPNWKREMEEWSDFNVVVYHDSEKSQESRAIIREHEWYNHSTGQIKFNVLLTTYEIVLSDAEYLAEIPWFLAVIDEGHRLKSTQTKLADAFKYIKPDRRVLLTGTPIQNSVQELFNLLSFLEPSKFLSYDAFSKKIGTNVDDSEKLMKLREEIQPFVLRRLKETVEKSIPKKEETIIDIELTTTQKTYYRAIFEKNREFLEEGITSKTSLPNLLNLEVQLRNHPLLINGAMEHELPEHLSEQVIMEKTIKASGKLVLLDKLLPKLKEEGHKVLIFSQMRRMLEIVSDYMKYKQYTFERFDGMTKSLDRQAAIDRFCAKNSNVFAFLLTTRAGGQGLNLVAADTVIIFDSDWNPQQDLQAQARCHRIGQMKEVKVFRFVTKNTYEADMFDRASRKLGLGHAILKSVEHGTGTKDLKDLKVLDNMLRHGAYALLEEDDTAAKKFEESNIDEILKHSSRKLEMKSSIKKKRLSENGDEEEDEEEEEEEDDDHEDGQPNGHSSQIGVGLGIHAFTRSSFTADANDSSLNMNDTDFW
ncbi:chromodomain-helicase-DNA-binding protein, partial [Reticulomyxa filosa]